MKTSKSQIIFSILFALFGVLLPMIALAIEYSTHMCRKDLGYDPIPTVGHIIVVALVPLILAFWGTWRLQQKEAANPFWRISLGAVASISFIYALPMVPILPIAVIAMLFGIGFLPFAPVGSCLFASIALWKCRKSVLTASDASPKKFVHFPWGIAGLTIGFAIMVFFALPEMQTQRALELARKGSSAERADAISTLRTLPDSVVKTSICDYRRVRGPNPLSPFTMFVDRMNNDYTYQPELFWKVTGERCAKKSWSRNARFITPRDDSLGLSFSNSRFDGSIDAKAATAYTEWTYTLKNDSKYRREADFIVQLPKDSVVSRVTLWVHGEPREATFAGRGKATAAYEAVVRKAKDPILVSEIGPNRIRVRMFPMLAGKTMKARIGITTPLHLSQEGNTLSLAKIIAGNVSHDVSHRVWMESKSEIQTSLIKTELDEQAYQIRGDISDKELASLAIKTAFFKTRSLTKKNDIFATQSLTMQAPQNRNLIFLVDGSIRMKNAVGELRQAFDRLNFEGEVSLLFVNDESEISEKITRKKWSKVTREEFKNELSKFRFIGGRETSKALDLAQKFSKSENDIIIWIHAAQTVTFSEANVGYHFTTPIIDVQVDGGRDVNLEALHLEAKVEGLPRQSTLTEDLGAYFETLSKPTVKRKVVYGLDNDPRTDGQDWHQTSDHLFRLAARDEVDRLLLASKREEAIKMAHENQIVTRVSAAVVLETEEQYKQNGLDQANGKGVPTVPEPEEWALMIIGAFFLLFVLWRKRKDEDRSRMSLI